MPRTPCAAARRAKSGPAPTEGLEIDVGKVQDVGGGIDITASGLSPDRAEIGRIYGEGIPESVP